MEYLRTNGLSAAVVFNIIFIGVKNEQNQLDILLLMHYTCVQLISRKSRELNLNPPFGKETFRFQFKQALEIVWNEHNKRFT